MTTAKSCCFIQDKNIDINNKTAKTKATWGFPIFRTDEPSFFKGFNEESESRGAILTKRPSPENQAHPAHVNSLFISTTLACSRRSDNGKWLDHTLHQPVSFFSCSFPKLLTDRLSKAVYWKSVDWFWKRNSDKLTDLILPLKKLQRQRFSTGADPHRFHPLTEICLIFH